MDLHLKQGYYKDIRPARKLQKTPSCTSVTLRMITGQRIMSVRLSDDGKGRSILQRPQKGEGPDSWSSAGMALRMSTPLSGAPCKKGIQRAGVGSTSFWSSSSRCAARMEEEKYPDGQDFNVKRSNFKNGYYGEVGIILIALTDGNRRAPDAEGSLKILR